MIRQDIRVFVLGVLPGVLLGDIEIGLRWGLK